MKQVPKKFWAGGFLFNPQTHEVFLHKRDEHTTFNPNKWAFFGGLNEGNETPKECFLRELHEEIGLSLGPGEVGLYREYLNVELDTYRYAFYGVSEVTKDELVLGEGAGFDWIPSDKLSEYDLTEKTREDLAFFVEYLSDGWGD